MASRLTIVRKCSKIGKSRLHDLVMVGWSRCIARYGKQAFAEELGVTTAAIDKQLSGSMPDFALIADARGFDEDVLNEVCDALGIRIVPRNTVCDSDHLNLVLARALVKINEATDPKGPGGRAIVHTEYLDGESIMLELHKATGAWLEKCAEARTPRMVRS